MKLSFKYEPTLWIAFIRAVIYLAILFGATVTDAQMAGIIVVVETGLALFNRKEVVPTDKVAVMKTPQEMKE